MNMSNEDPITPGRLSSKEYWDSVLRSAELPRLCSPEKYPPSITIRFIDEVLRSENKETFMEIGCGSSGWLPYFAREYGLHVSGLDYSEIGCRIAEENLKMLNIKYDEIICADIFSWESEKKCDIIFSYGVIEHFENPGDILRICFEHLNDSGIIITLVPNLNGLMGFLCKRFVPEVYAMHKVFSKEFLRVMHEQNGFVNIKTDFAGTFFLGMIPWSKSEIVNKSKILKKLIGIVDYFSTGICKMIPQYPSIYLSPYLIAIMKKTVKPDISHFE